MGTSAATGRAFRAHAAFAQQCSDSQYPATRDPLNPLALPTPPGADPLPGAHLFVDGPRHGPAAGAIAQELGIDPTSYPDGYSWAQFQHDISPGGSLYGRLAGSPALANDVALLSRIASQESTQSISEFAMGGGPGATFDQVQKILCHNLTADPTPDTVPVFSTFFIYPNGQFCPPLSAIEANGTTFRRQIDELAAGTGRHPAVYLLEIDAVGTSHCLTGAALSAWEEDLRYEVEKLTALPHTVVYLEAGAADEDSPQYAAAVINAVCVVGHANVCAGMRGIYVNGTHFDWTASEISYGDQVAAQLRYMIRGETGAAYTAHVVVNTAQNGRGPKLNPHPVEQGTEDLCNPTGRGLGRDPTAATNPTFDGHSFALTDAFLWTGEPGRSHNSNCHPGDQPAGVFDVRFALELAANASNQLGPPNAPLPAPVLGRSVNVSLVSGAVYVELPRAHHSPDAGTPSASAALTKGQGFVPLTQARQIPTGSVIDARAGSLRVTTATALAVGKTQSGVFGGGVFGITQARSGVQKGLATMSLQEGTFRGSPSYADCTVKGAADGSAPVALAALSSRVLQTLHASVRGRFSARGRYSTGTVRGTVWDTSDRCDGTLTVVRRGTVLVSDFGRRITVAVHAGHSYLARAFTRAR
jgi:hypothetical protein